MRKEGQFNVEDFYLNVGGLNTADSPFVVQQDQATDGQNFDYIKRGGVQKRAGHTRLNAVADTNATTLGLGLFDKPSATRTVVRAAGTKLQKFNFNTFAFTSLSEDTVTATTTFLANATTAPVPFTMFNTPADTGALWAVGGGLTNLVGAYSDTKATQNGVPSPTLTTFTVVESGSGTLPTGYYTYSLAYRKASTQAIGNVLLSTAEVIGNNGTGKGFDLAWTLSNNDMTKYDKVYVYRSSLSSSATGSAGFTAGVLVAILASSATTYTDTGTGYVSSSANVPRAGNTILDNSQLPSGSYETIATFKRHLATANGSTVYLSDTNKPESWPTVNTFTIPSGGKITGLAALSLTSGVTGSTIDEVLCIFKERELWVLTGNSTSDWVLLFVDAVGATAQRLIVSGNGYLAWMNYRGVFMWNGGGKPTYVSQPIEDKFARNGDIDKSQLANAWGVFYPSRHEIQWYLSSKSLGTQKYALKLDLRLTTAGTEQNLTNHVMKGVFTPDVLTFPGYAGLVYTQSSTSTEELMYTGDDAGFIYNAYTGTADGTNSDVLFEYSTPHMFFGTAGARKRVSKVVVWVLDTGNYDLELDYWANYRYAESQASSRALPVSSNTQSGLSLWDTAIWDTGIFDTVGTQQVKPLTFILNSQTLNNNEGDAIRLRLKQSGHLETVIIYGFSVYYTEVATSH